jgi:S-adenosylmethionine hydrolase
MKPSGIITLTTDFGLSDPYVGMMKGIILSVNPDARIVDLTHQIEAGDVLQAASLVHEAYPFFPKGTVHLVVVDPGVGSERRAIALETDTHLFVGPDNGIFSPLFQPHKKRTIVHLTERKYFLPSISHTFHGRDIFAPVAARLSLGVDLEMMGPLIDDPFSLPIPRPKEKGKSLYGQIVRVDHFGNLVTNIHRKELGRFLGSAPPIIRAGDLVLRRLCHTYAEVGEGEPLALLGSSNFLEIAVNLGRASENVGIHSGEIIGSEVEVSRAE